MGTDAARELPASVVFPTHNRRELLPRVLPSILADPATAEVVVVVDGSRDGSLELLESMATSDPRIKPVFIDRRGAPYARLAGVRAATGSLIVMIDDDETLEPGAISGHVRRQRDLRDTVVVGYVEMQYPASRRPGDFSRYMYARQYERDCLAYEADPGRILRNLWGNHYSIRREDFLRAMDDDEFVVGYHSDLEFGALCLERGLRAVFDRSLRATHLYERDRAGFLRDARSSGRSRIAVHRRHPAVLEPIAPDFVDRGLPPGRRAVLRLAMRYRPVEWVVDSALTVAGRLRLWPLETAAAGVVWGVAQKRGALEAWRELEGEQEMPRR